MTVVQPAKPDRQSKDNPLPTEDQIEYREVDGVQVIEFKYRTSELGVLVHLFGDAYDVFALDLQVRDGRQVARPDRVVVQGPPNWHLRVTVNRQGDVVQHPYPMTADTELLPAAWFQEGDYVQVERTQPFEPKPQMPAEASRASWLGGEAGAGVGDYIGRRRG